MPRGGFDRIRHTHYCDSFKITFEITSQGNSLLPFQPSTIRGHHKDDGDGRRDLHLPCFSGENTKIPQTEIGRLPFQAVALTCYFQYPVGSFELWRYYVRIAQLFLTRVQVPAKWAAGSLHQQADEVLLGVVSPAPLTLLSTPKGGKGVCQMRTLLSSCADVLCGWPLNLTSRKNQIHCIIQAVYFVITLYYNHFTRYTRITIFSKNPNKFLAEINVD